MKKFKIGSDYSLEIEKNLDIINYTHSNESNPLTKYALIENSSKLLRKELEEMKIIVQKEILDKMNTLT